MEPFCQIENVMIERIFKIFDAREVQKNHKHRFANIGGGRTIDLHYMRMFPSSLKKYITQSPEPELILNKQREVVRGVSHIRKRRKHNSRFTIPIHFSTVTNIDRNKYQSNFLGMFFFERINGFKYPTLGNILEGLFTEHLIYLDRTFVPTGNESI